MSQSERTYSEAEVRHVAFQAAGIGSAAVMRKAPHIVMPTEEIIDAVDQLLADARDGVLDVG